MAGSDNDVSRCKVEWNFSVCDFKVRVLEFCSGSNLEC